MAPKQHKQQRTRILLAYILMLLTVFSVVPLILGYWFASRAINMPDMEVWLHSHGLWIARNLLIFASMAIFSALWFIPLAFFVWDQFIWVTACTVVGVIFAIVAWLFLVNAWLKGIFKFIKHKPVY